MLFRVKLARRMLFVRDHNPPLLGDGLVLAQHALKTAVLLCRHILVQPVQQLLLGVDHLQRAAEQRSALCEVRRVDMLLEVPSNDKALGAAQKCNPAGGQMSTESSTEILTQSENLR